MTKLINSEQSTINIATHSRGDQQEREEYDTEIVWHVYSDTEEYIISVAVLMRELSR